MRRFSLHRRGEIFYAQLKNPQTGRFGTSKSTGAKDRDTALLVVAQWLREGVPTGRKRELRPVGEAFQLDAVLTYLRTADSLTAEDAGRILGVLKERGLADGVVKAGLGSELFGDFLTRFWTYDESAYVREKLAHGQRIGRRYCNDALGHVRQRWVPFFKGRNLMEISKRDIKDFAMSLAESGLSAKSINNMVEPGSVALKWAHGNDLIPANPALGIRRFSGEPRRRGVLKPEEARLLFRVTWDDERSRVGNLVAMTTGLRAGEVLALRVQDIGEDRLHVRHSWSNEDGLKSTKTNEERTVPLLPGVRSALLTLVASNPWGGARDDFVFYGLLRRRPMDFHFLIGGLRQALAAIGINEEERRRRNIVYHSWRHYFAARMADRIDARKVQLATGHKTATVFQAYADHRLESDLTEVAGAMAEVFGNIVPFAIEAPA